MKKFGFLAIVLYAGIGVVRSQTVTVMAEQLAELRALQYTIGQGYRIMTSGLDTIGMITGEEFQLHKDFFASLETVKPDLGNDLKVSAVRELQAALVQRINAALDYWRRQQYLTNKNN